MSNPIPLAYIPEIKEENPQKMQETQSSTTTVPVDNEPTKKRYFFADEIKINDQTVLTIPLENQFYEEEKPKRKSRWGDKPEKKKTQQEVVFNPLQALTQGSLLSIMGGNNNQFLQKTSSANLFEKKRNSKWAPEYEKTLQPPLFHQVQKNVPIDEIEYLIRLYRLDEINRKLTINDYDLNDPDIRSPSPDPIYDPKTGVRTNTRENRAKENLLREKYNIIEECMQMKRTFVPPPDYKPPKKSRKIYLPDTLNEPDSNYIGMIIGPRGTTQKALEQKSGCKISIRGKGSTKFKKTELESDDKLHILIQADTDENLEKGQELIEKILKGDVDETNELKKNQMLQLQAITGVLKDDYCENCHERGHRIWNCPNKLAWKRTEIKCEICGDRSHPTTDCPQKGMRPNMNGKGGDQGIENEFARFLQEVEGEKAKKLLSLAASQIKSNVPASNVVVQQQNVSNRLNFLTDNFNPILQLTNGPANQNDELRQKTPLTAVLLAKMQSGIDCFENNQQPAPQSSTNNLTEDLKQSPNPSFMNPFPFNTVNAYPSTNPSMNSANTPLNSSMNNVLANPLNNSLNNSLNNPLNSSLNSSSMNNNSSLNNNNSMNNNNPLNNHNHMIPPPPPPPPPMNTANNYMNNPAVSGLFPQNQQPNHLAGFNFGIPGGFAFPMGQIKPPNMMNPGVMGGPPPPPPGTLIGVPMGGPIPIGGFIVGPMPGTGPLGPNPGPPIGFGHLQPGFFGMNNSNNK